MPPVPFFTFPDRSLHYDCPKCGQACCRGKGVLLDVAAELVQLAAHRPRAAFALQARAGTPLMKQAHDGCAMLMPDGLCSVEVEQGRARKPAVCRLFPFNKVFQLGEARVIDFAAAFCPLEDVADQRTGQAWSDLAAELEELSGRDILQTGYPLPEGAEQFGWLAFETRVRDAIERYLAAPDYADFAGYQEAMVVALARGQPLPEPGSDLALERAARLRSLLGRWRTLFSGEADARGSALAARLLALLTSQFRMTCLIRRGAMPYTTEIQRMPRRLLAASLFVEMLAQSRSRAPTLRSASDVLGEDAPLLDILALWDWPARLAAPLATEAYAPAVGALLRSLEASLGNGQRKLGDAMEEALAAEPLHLRGLVLSALARSDARLVVG